MGALGYGAESSCPSGGDDKRRWSTCRFHSSPSSTLTTYVSGPFLLNNDPWNPSCWSSRSLISDHDML